MYDPPRALLRRHNVTVDLTAAEFQNLIRLLEAEAVRVADHPEQADFADYLFQRVARLREAGR